VRDAQGRIYRTHQGAPQIPSEYADLIDNVLGLDTRPQANPRFRPLRSPGFHTSSSEPAYSPDKVAALYNFPTDLTGHGQTIALLEFGGGFRRRDLRAYFHQLGLVMPEVSAVSVGAAANAPENNPDGPDGEVMLDIEVAGAVAPGSHLAVYFAANTSRGFLRGINAAVHDELRRPSILSISWGGPEATWTAADMRSIDRALEAAAAIGVSVFVAAGDSGSSDGMAGGLAHVDFPASSPLSTACGGTRLVFDEAGALVDEVVWNDGDQGGTGGGVSDVYSPPPVYQTGPVIRIPASVNPGGQTGRGVPDVSGNADPVTGYKVRVDGVDTVVGGTSAVAPLWAALFARINEGCGAPVGFANTLLYSVVAATPGALRDITEGDNDLDGSIGGYPAGAGWDPCSGLGTPADGAKILQAVKAA
jgi:kumamolisin